MRYYGFWLIIFVTLPLAVARPIIGLFVYTFFNLFRPEMLFWGKMHMGGRALFMLYAATLLGVIVNAKFDVRAMARPTLLLTFGIWLTVAFTILAGKYQSPELLQWRYCTEILKIGILCYIILVTLDTPKRFFQYIELNIGATALLALWGVQQYFAGNVRLEGLGGEAIGDSNYAAAYFVLFLPLVLSKALEKNDLPRKLFYLGSAGVTFAVIPCTQSRGGLMGAVVALVLFFLFTRHRRQLTIYGVAMVILVAPIITAGVLERMQTVQSGEIEEMDASSLSRVVMWRAAWYTFLDNPVFGVGYKCFPRYKTRYVNRVIGDFSGEIPADLIEKQMLHPKVTHSLLFQILSEGGILLLIPVVSLYGGSILWSRRSMRRHKLRSDAVGVELRDRLGALNAGLAGWLVCMIFLDGLVGFFSYIVVTLCAVARWQLEQTENEAVDATPSEEPAVGSRPGRRVAVASLARNPVARV